VLPSGKSLEVSPDAALRGDAAVIIPLNRQEKRAVSVARAILHDIRHDQLVAGDRLLPEVTMLGRYQVARGTLREALRILEVQGLISMRPGREGGPVVNDPTPRDFSHVLTLFLQGMDVTMQHLLDARLSIEPIMARLAAESSDAASHHELAEIVARTEEAVEWTEIATTTADFHHRILTMSGNAILDLWAATLQQTMDPREARPLPDQTITSIQREHVAIGRAILDRDGDTVAELMADHMAQVYSRTRFDADYLRQRVEWR
jgi:DNA-binding FadR family transcriptional regulator